MAVHHPGLQQEVDDFMGQIRALVTASIQNAAIGSAGLRVYDGGWIRIENGGLEIDGEAIVRGLLRVTGRLEGSGTLDWTGPWFLRGLGEITGDVDITGALDVLNRLTLGPSGYIEAGTVRIDRAGTYGGRIASTGAILALSAGGSVIIDTDYLIANSGSFSGDLSAQGAISSNIKNFKIPHPVKLDHYLLHGATESPVSGVEYWGEETLPESGELTVTLPDYFEALTKTDGRAVMVTARGFVADWGDIEDGTFTVTGTPGGRFSWLVKAERKGADFDTELPVYGPLRKS